MDMTARQAGFTLVELLIVVVVLAILAAVVVPQFTDAGEGAKLAALQANLAIARDIIGRYMAEHRGRPPSIDHNGNPDHANSLTRLTGRTQPNGMIDGGGPLGPYLIEFPVNPFNGKGDVRLDGAPAGANTHGWHVDTSTGRFSADDSPEHAAL
jgi:prepilin-type N-terminal cleavage/methylation domain-containing protein